MNTDNSFADRLLHWYARHGRRLPWRGHPDPYAVWVSEIMLQQTRVEAVTRYFLRWMETFPTVAALAQAPERQVLALWEGLGYYSRARNLHKAAQIVVREHGGELPRDAAALRKLPGIGRYTVGAILSIAFGLDEPTLDGNLRRVFARLFDVSEPADSPAGEERLWVLAGSHLPPGRAGDYNQALMDLGATICLPREPRCQLCPLMETCQARIHGTHAQRPVLKPKKAVPQHVHAAAVIVQRGRALLRQRPTDGLLGGLWEFPNARVTGDPRKQLATALRKELGLRVRAGEQVAVVEHAYTHFKVSVHAFRAELSQQLKEKTFRWVRLSELDEFPMGKVDRRIAKVLAGKD